MRKTIASITMSLDGYIAGPNVSQENPMGINGQQLHKWIFAEKQKEDEEFLSELMDCGAVIMGSTTYKTAINGVWERKSPFFSPVIVLSSEQIRVIEGFSVVSEGIECALAEAKAVAKDKAVLIMGGARVVHQYLFAGLLDELNIQIAPVLLGSGTRLFMENVSTKIDLINIRTVQTKGVTHLKFKPSKKI